ncbi:MAG: YutD-like domain-containing protein [Anaeroplasmataceae bacterium]
MVIKTTKGYYEVIKNVRDALNIETFQSKYLEEYFDSYLYIVGDIASNTLRLKGFSVNPGKGNYFKNIPDYLCESCAYRGAYFILKRITEAEYNNLKEKYAKKPNLNITKGEPQGFVMEKKPFDKDQLVLESSAPRAPHIVFDMTRINTVKTYPLPDELRDDPKTIERLNKEVKNKPNNKPKDNNKLPNNNNNNNGNKKSFSNQGNRKAFSNNKK